MDDAATTSVNSRVLKAMMPFSQRSMEIQAHSMKLGSWRAGQLITRGRLLPRRLMQSHGRFILHLAQQNQTIGFFRDLRE